MSSIHRYIPSYLPRYSKALTSSQTAARTHLQHNQDNSRAHEHEKRVSYPKLQSILRQPLTLSAYGVLDPTPRLRPLPSIALCSHVSARDRSRFRRQPRAAQACARCHRQVSSSNIQAPVRSNTNGCVDESPAQTALFRDISSYILKTTNQSTLVNGEPAAKKRKLDGPSGTQNGHTGTGSLTNVSVPAWRSYPATSFSIPQRKKLTLELVLGKGGDGGIRALGAGNTVEFSIGWKDIGESFQTDSYRTHWVQHLRSLTPYSRPDLLPTDSREG